MRTPEEILNLILNVAKEDDHIRAVYMVGSRANKDCPVDIYQDFDVTFLVDVVAPYWDNEAWIEEKFGKRVRELVQSETEDKRADLPPADTWRIRKEESLSVLKNTEDTDVLMVWLGDKLANMRSIYRDFKVEGELMWQRFNQKDVNEQAWYYRSIAKFTERLSDTSAWTEYKTLTELVFGKGE